MANKRMRKLGLAMLMIIAVSQVSGTFVFAASENVDGEEAELDLLIEETEEVIEFDEIEEGADSEPELLEANPEQEEDEWIYITKVDCEYTTSIKVGESRAVATIEPADFNEPITFTSTNEEVVTVDENGIMTGVSRGRAEIYISWGYTIAMTNVAVLEDGMPQVMIYDYYWTDENVTYPSTFCTTYPYTMIAKVYPEDKEYPIIWSSEDETKATITEEGVVTGLKAGPVRIKATIMDEDVEVSADYYSIEFEEAEEVYDPGRIALRNVTVPGGVVIIGINETVNPWIYEPEIYSETAYFSCGDTSIATVSADGSITGIAPGCAGIMVCAREDFSGGSCGGAYVYVTDGQPAIFIRAPKLCWVDVRNTDHMPADIVADSDDYTVLWESSDENVATIDENGDIVYRKEGLVKFIAKIEQIPEATAYVVRIVESGLASRIKVASAADEEIVNDVVELIRPNSDEAINEMKEALEESAEVQECLKKLEETYNNKNNIEVSETSEVADIPAEDIEVVGAGLNALEENADINLEILPVDESKIDDMNGHSDVLAFDMELYSDDEQANEVDITIPVIVTLPIPDDVDTDSLQILHYSDNGGTEVIDPVFTDDGSGVVLTLSHFSTFAYAWDDSNGNKSSDPHEQVVSFVDRIYTVWLERSSDSDGAADWTKKLEDKSWSGAQVAEFFVFSKESMDKNRSNEDFIDVLYKLLMNRDPAEDPSGYAYWKEQMQNGMSKYQLVASFIASPEYTGICADYGIERGSVDMDTVNQVQGFVGRFYTLAMERDADQSGVDYWTAGLRRSEFNGASIAANFFFSDEMNAKHISDEKYIELLYQVMMGRPSDEGGKAYWLGNMADGMTKEQVLNGFITSPEFTGICADYGIDSGNL